MQSVTTNTLAETSRLARTWERAQAIVPELRKGGEYTAYQQTPSVWSVYNRTNDAAYLIDLTGKPSCTCPDFAKHGHYCKHTLALTTILDDEAEEAQIAAQELEYAACENEVNGVDYHL